MQITKDSHVHDLTNDQLGYIADKLAERDGFFIERVDIPTELGLVPCALVGPLMGDAPVNDHDVMFAKRGDREYDSRMINPARYIHAPRSVSYVTVIAGPHEGDSCILYTVFGGPLAPKEPADPTIKPEDLEASRAFWDQHALAAND